MGGHHSRSRGCLGQENGGSTVWCDCSSYSDRMNANWVSESISRGWNLGLSLAFGEWVVSCSSPVHFWDRLGSDSIKGAVLEDVPKEDGKLKIEGSAMVAYASSKEEVLETLKKDIYAESGVWDFSKVSSWYPSRRWPRLTMYRFRFTLSNVLSACQLMKLRSRRCSVASHYLSLVIYTLLSSCYRPNLSHLGWSSLTAAFCTWCTI